MITDRKFNIGELRLVGTSLQAQATRRKHDTSYTRNVYLKKAMKLDAKFAPGDTCKPFSEAIKQTFGTGRNTNSCFGHAFRNQ